MICSMADKRVGIKEFAYSSMILTLSNLALKALNFLLLPLYTKYLSPAELGISDTITNFTAFILPLLICGFDSAFSAFYYDSSDNERAMKVFNTVQRAMELSSLALIVLALLSRPISILLFHTGIYTNAILISIIGLAFNLWMLSYSLHIRMQNRMGIYGVINIITSATMLLLNVFMVVGLRWGYLALIVSTTISHALQLVLYVKFSKVKKNKQYIDKVLFKQMLKYALPMVPIVVVNWVLSLSDRYIILYFWDESVVGLYGIAARFVTVLNVVVSSITTAFTTFAFSNISEEKANERYAKVLNYIFILLIIIVTFVSCFAEDIIKFMTDQRYYSSYRLLQPLLYGQLCYCVATIVGYGFAYVRKSKYYLIPSSIAAIMNLILNIVFVPKYGAYAAALTTLVGYIIMMVITYYLSIHVYPCNYKMPRIILLIVFSYVLSYWGSTRGVIIQVVVWMTIIAMTCLIYRKDIKEVLTYLISKVNRQRKGI